MIPGHLHIDDAADTRTALGRGTALWRALVEGCSFYAAALDGPPTLVLGAFQHAAQAVAAERQGRLELARRASGGASVMSGPGTLYVALGLREASSLMACPAGRILNRNVRGLLQGVRLLHVPAHYFGRDFISFAGRPGAYAGYREALDGRVLLEFFIGLERAFAPEPELSGYPQRAEAAWRGKAPISLREAGATQSAREILERIAEGHARLYGIDFEHSAPSAAELASGAEPAGDSRVEPADADGDLAWSHPIEEAIGFVSAAVALDGAGHLSRLELAGDFMQREGSSEELGRRLHGVRPTPETVGAALDAVYGARPGVIEGVRSLKSVRDAILDAAHRAEGVEAPR